jgi:choline dehydrogenase-like flavoprotein
VIDQYDVVVIGTGAGGGTIARALAGSSARVLVLERGGMVPQEPENWNPQTVWRDLRYRVTERWIGGDGLPFVP